MIVNLFMFSVMTGCATAWFVILLKKLGICEWVQVHAVTDLITNLFSCDYCMNWWLSWCVIVSIFVFCTITERPLCMELVLVPFISTPIGRFLS